MGTLDIEAAIDYKMGGVQPITSQEFYLLDMDLIGILKKSGIKEKKGFRLPKLDFSFKASLPSFQLLPPWQGQLAGKTREIALNRQ